MRAVARSILRDAIARSLTSKPTDPGAGGWTPAQWFLASEQGAWYDPSDFSTMFQDAAGTTPVTAVEQPVGLVLDKRLGLVEGAELVTNGTFDTNTTGWTAALNCTISAVAGRLRVTATSSPSLAQYSFATVVGRTYRIRATYTAGTATTPLFRAGSSSVGIDYFALAGATVLGTIERVFVATGTTAYVSVGSSGASAGQYADFDNISVKELPGNHASQATSASRPVLSARKNLLTQSENFGASPWATVNATITTGQAANAAGQMTLCKVMATATAASYVAQPANGSGSPAGITVRFLARKGSGATDCNSFGLYNQSTATLLVLFTVNYDTGVATHSYGSGATMTDLGGGLWEVKYTRTTGIAAGNNLQVYGGFTGNAETAGEFAYIGEIQLEAGSTATRYQRVNTAADYDTVGFPHYFALDRVDDHATVAAGGGGTTGICVCAAIRAGGAGNARTIWSDRGTNTGYRLSINASNQLVLSAGNGSAHTEVVGPTVTAGTDYVVTGWHDGTNLNVQLNAGAATSAAFGTATAGTAGFTIGKDNGAATGYYGDRIYEIVYRKNDTSSAGDRTSLIAYMAKQAGITL